MGMGDIGRKVQVGLVAAGLVLQTSPIAWAQVASIEQRIDFNDPVIAAGIEHIPDPEARAIARELHGQCKEDRQVADAVTREAQALAGADELTREMIGGAIDALQGQGDAKVRTVVEALTELTNSLNQPGVTLVDVQEKLASLGPILADLEAFKDSLPSSGDMSKAREFWAGMESDPVAHALEAHFKDEMGKSWESGGSLSPEAMRELGEQMLAAGVNPREVMQGVAREMAALGGPPSEAMVAEARAHMETMLVDPNLSESHRAEMATMFEAWQSGNYEAMMTSMGTREYMGPMGFEHMGPMGFEHMGPMEMYVHTGTTEVYANAAESVQQHQAYIDTQSPGSGTAHTLVEIHTLSANGHTEEHWDSNKDGIADHTHPIGTMPH